MVLKGRSSRYNITTLQKKIEVVLKLALCFSLLLVQTNSFLLHYATNETYNRVQKQNGEIRSPRLKLIKQAESERFTHGILFLQVIAKPGTVKTYKRFEAEIYVLTKDEGGRHTAFFSNYRPQFYMRTADITGKVELPENVKMVMPGDNVTAVFELISPVPLEAGMY